MTDLTRAHTLISYYQKKYKERYGQSTVVNRNKVQYLIVNMLKDLSMAEAKDLVDFYIKTDKSPSLITLCYEYDDVLVKKDQEAKDLENRINLLAETKKTVEEFRRRYGAG